MSRKITVTSSPFKEDYEADQGGGNHPPPWTYSEDAFVTWVDEVFMEGYKKTEDAPFPSLEEAISTLRGMGYLIEVTEEESGCPST